MLGLNHLKVLSKLSDSRTLKRIRQPQKNEVRGTKALEQPHYGAQCPARGCARPGSRTRHPQGSARARSGLTTTHLRRTQRLEPPQRPPHGCYRTSHSGTGPLSPHLPPSRPCQQRGLSIAGFSERGGTADGHTEYGECPEPAPEVSTTPTAAPGRCPVPAPPLPHLRPGERRRRK